MLFNSLEFVLLVVLVGAWLVLARSNRQRKLGLLAASYYFYAYWDWRFLSLLLLSTVVDFGVGRALARSDSAPRRRALLALSLVCNLGLLGFFKYFNFFVDSLAPLLGQLGLRTGTLSIILPVGISFYTFQTLSYTIDVYRRRLKACDDFFDFALFVSFFPQLVAGPIVRAADFLPQLEERRDTSWTRLFEGFRQFVIGLFKKVVVADHLSEIVDPVYANLGAFDGLTVWAAALAYTVQIYCDFSGYSDMAIGVARALGYDLPENFAHPYRALDPSDFWRRWHISLSNWLRDYLYIPLGGNRSGPRRTYINLALTMLLGGLWHGAAWTFVAWGAYHGLALGLHRWWSRDRRGGQGWRLPRPLAWLATLLMAVVGWVLFRAPDFATAAAALRAMFLGASGLRWLPPYLWLGLAVIVLGHGVKASRWGRWLELPPRRLSTPVALFLLLWLVLLFYPRGITPFIYFQF